MLEEHRQNEGPTIFFTTRTFQARVNEYTEDHNIDSVHWKSTGCATLSGLIQYLVDKGHIKKQGFGWLITNTDASEYQDEAPDNAVVQTNNLQPEKHEEASSTTTPQPSQQNNINLEPEIPVACPVCNNKFPASSINQHLDECLSLQMLMEEKKQLNASQGCNNSECSCHFASNSFDSISNSDYSSSSDDEIEKGYISPVAPLPCPQQFSSPVNQQPLSAGSAALRVQQPLSAGGAAPRSTQASASTNSTNSVPTALASSVNTSSTVKRSRSHTAINSEPAVPRINFATRIHALPPQQPKQTQHTSNSQPRGQSQPAALQPRNQSTEPQASNPFSQNLVQSQSRIALPSSHRQLMRHHTVALAQRTILASANSRPAPRSRQVSVPPSAPIDLDAIDVPPPRRRKRHRSLPALTHSEPAAKKPHLEPQLAYNVDSFPVEYAPVECIICLDDITAGQSYATTPCLCKYHEACLKMWIQRKCYCPIHQDVALLLNEATPNDSTSVATVTVQ